MQRSVRGWRGRGHLLRAYKPNGEELIAFLKESRQALGITTSYVKQRCVPGCLDITHDKMLRGAYVHPRSAWIIGHQLERGSRSNEARHGSYRRRNEKSRKRRLKRLQRAHVCIP